MDQPILYTRNNKNVSEMSAATRIFPYKRKVRNADGEVTGTVEAYFFSCGDIKGVAPDALVDAAKNAANPKEYLRNCRIAQVSKDPSFPEDKTFWCLMRPGAEAILSSE